MKPRSSPTVVETWSTASLGPRDLTQAWEEALQSSYGGWAVQQAVGEGFRAHIRKREFGGLRVVECECDPCAGQRLPISIQRDSAPFIGVQITRAGRERFHVADEVLNIGAGDLVIWTSEQPTTFTVLERLHKVSLVLPWAEVQDLLPHGSRFTGTVLDSRRGIGAILFSHLDHLARQLESFSDDDQAAVRRATLELLRAAMSHRMAAPQRNLSMRYLHQLQDYILRHLADESLSPARIAEANRMSLRYVHLLFAHSGTSVSAWIRQQRLERCREALENRQQRGRSVSEIAYAWAFADPSHFARVFKQCYGSSPTEWRERALSPGR